MRAHAEIGPERLKEVAIATEWNSANHIAQGGAEENGEQGACDKEDQVEKTMPNAVRQCARGTRCRCHAA